MVYGRRSGLHSYLDSSRSRINPFTVPTEGLSDLLYDNKLIKEEYRGEFAKRLKRFAAFFKHAQIDPDAEIEFDPTLNEGLLVFVTVGIQTIDPHIGPIETSFLHWVALHRPDIYALGKEFEKQVSAETLNILRNMDRREYFETYHVRLGIADAKG